MCVLTRHVALLRWRCLCRYKERLLHKTFTAWHGRCYGVVFQTAARRRWARREGGTGISSRVSAISHTSSLRQVLGEDVSFRGADESPSKLSLRPYVDMMN